MGGKKPSLLGRVFRERNIYLRTESGVRYISIKPWVQVTALSLLAAASFWTAYATVNTLFKDQMLVLKDRKIARERGAHARQMARQQDIFAAQRKQLEDRIKALDARLMADQQAWLEKVEQVRRDYLRLLERQRLLGRYLEDTGLLGKSGREEAEEAVGGKSGKGDLKALPPRGDAGDDFRIRFAAPFTSAAEARHVLELLRRLHHQGERRQLALLDAAMDKARRRLAKVRKIYRRLGVDPVKVAANSSHEPSAEAIGGPYMPLMEREAGGRELARRMNAIAALMEEEDKLLHEFQRLPVALPMRSYTRISSRFGWRRDPFRRRLALHAGIDFKAPYGAPVLAAAPGVVTRAGWTGSYGKLVEIRHNNGIVTRYAHLSRVLVRSGQRVSAGKQIGRMGNTGRSTGPHLHYETRLFGRPVNPARFWKAKHDIRKVKADH